MEYSEDRIREAFHQYTESAVGRSDFFSSFIHPENEVDTSDLESIFLQYQTSQRLIGAAQLYIELCEDPAVRNGLARVILDSERLGSLIRRRFEANTER